MSRLRWQLPLLVVAIVALAVVVRACVPRDPMAPVERIVRGRTTITHSVAVERVRAVAKLVSSETTVRDVVVYENVRFGARKKALVVVTGRILAGFDLEKRGTRVEIDSAARRITITLPPAEVLAVEITDYDTYDESAGLLNRFRPADRDTIHLLAREQLVRMATRSAALEHANRSARELLSTLFSQDGYVTDVRIATVSVPRG
jgi:hypothetical protein